MHRRAFIKSSLAGLSGALLLDMSCSTANHQPKPDARLKGAFRSPERNEWTFVHLEGTPAEIGYQHGYLLSDRIEDTTKVTILEQTHGSKYGWNFYRDAAKNMLWPKIEAEYREELQGIADGLRARGSKSDLWDVVALNASMEWDYYVKEYDKTHQTEKSAELMVPEHCSAFAATGSYTRDGKVVIAHNCWTNYLDGERWTIIYDIVPSHGYRILMGSLGIKATVGDAQALIAPGRTFDTVTNAPAGGLNYTFGKYRIEITEQPAFSEGPDPAQDDPPQAFARSLRFSIADHNLENLYDYRDDPFSGSDFTGDSGCSDPNTPFPPPVRPCGVATGWTRPPRRRRSRPRRSTAAARAASRRDRRARSTRRARDRRWPQPSTVGPPVRPSP